jgi:antitoxin component of MazEF toxin-antitoxin module
MLAVIQKWGNHQGLCFTPEMLKQAQLSLGDEVFITVKQGEIIIKPTAHGKGKYTFRDKSFSETFASKAELVAQMPSDYNPVEEDWGEAVGKEVW